MATIYPQGIDGYAQLPYVTDKVTEITAVTVNRIRDAVVTIEGELGIEPSGEYDTVTERLEAIESSSSELTDHASTHVNGGTDVIFGDRLRVTYVPSNYTRTTAPSEVFNLVELSAHLAGIDNEIAALSASVVMHASTHISGGSDEIDGDKLDIDYNPGVYSPSTSPSQVTSVDHLSAHLDGIDTAIGKITPSSSKVLYVDPTSQYADYNTIQDAITAGAALSPSIDDPVYVLIQPGTYTENLSLEAYVHLIGINSERLNFGGSIGPIVVGPPVKIVAPDSHTATGAGPFQFVFFDNVFLYRTAASTNPMIETTDFGIFIKDCVMGDFENSGSPNQGPLIRVSNAQFFVIRDSYIIMGENTTAMSANNGYIEHSMEGSPGGGGATAEIVRTDFDTGDLNPSDTIIYSTASGSGYPGNFDCRGVRNGGGAEGTFFAGEHMLRAEYCQLSGITINPTGSFNAQGGDLGVRMKFCEFEGLSFDPSTVTNLGNSTFELDACKYNNINNTDDSGVVVSQLSAATIAAPNLELKYGNITGDNVKEMLIDIDRALNLFGNHASTHEFNGPDEINSELLKCSYAPDTDGVALNRYTPRSYTDAGGFGDGYDGYSTSVNFSQLGAHLNGINEALDIINGRLVTTTGVIEYSVENDVTYVAVTNQTATSPTINLPLGTEHLTGRIVIKDAAGNAGTASITIKSTLETIDDSASYTLSTDFASVTLIYIPEFSNWMII